MGEAKRRGTREERYLAAIKRDRALGQAGRPGGKSRFLVGLAAILGLAGAVQRGRKW